MFAFRQTPRFVQGRWRLKNWISRLVADGDYVLMPS